MSAADTLQAAIDLLTAQRDASVQLPWMRTPNIQADAIVSTVGKPHTGLVARVSSDPAGYGRATCDLVATGSRLVDPILALLEYGLRSHRAALLAAARVNDGYEDDIDGEQLFLNGGGRHILTLAEAILEPQTHHV